MEHLLINKIDKGIKLLGTKNGLRISHIKIVTEAKKELYLHSLKSLI